MCKRIYISGKIGKAYPDEACMDKFYRAEQALKADGWEVFNPTRNAWQESLALAYESYSKIETFKNVSRYAHTLLYDLEVVARCDAIYMLPDFLDSKGAKAEHAFAIATGKEIIYDEELYNNGTMRR